VGDVVLVEWFRGTSSHPWGGTGESLGGNVAEQLHQYARVHEFVPVESWRKDGVEGWLFRDKENQTVFVETAEFMRESSTVESFS